MPNLLARLAAATRRSFAVHAVGVAVVLSGAGGGCAASREVGARAFHLATQLGPSPTERRAVPPPIESVCARGTIVWLVPTPQGVILVDAGFDDDARAVKHQLAGRRVLGVLLTHGHVDHAAGAAGLDAPVYVGRADAPALRGAHTFTALWPQLGEALGGVPVARGPVLAVDDGALVTLGGVTLRAIATPGHTAGSISWLLAAPGGTILFSGDALQAPNGDEIFPAPPGFTASPSDAYASMRRIRSLAIDWLADGHYGALRAPSAALARAVQRGHSTEGERAYPSVRPVGCGDDPDGT